MLCNFDTEDDRKASKKYIVFHIHQERRLAYPVDRKSSQGLRNDSKIKILLINKHNWLLNYNHKD